MFDNVAHHKIICADLNTLYSRKNHDYGDSFHQTFLEEGFAMPRIRLTDKLSRFKKLTANKERLTDSIDADVKDESVKDTLMDLANYAIMTIIEMERDDNLEGDLTNE